MQGHDFHIDDAIRISRACYGYDLFIGDVSRILAGFLWILLITDMQCVGWDWVTRNAIRMR